MIRILTLILLASLAAPRAVAQATFPELLADKASAAHAEKLATFGQFVGSWAAEGVEYNEDGTIAATTKGELHFHWILQGEAIQDVWMDTERSDDSPKTLGTTLRFYDPKTDTWSITWIHPRYATARTLTGRKVGDEIVIEGTSHSGVKYHWIFSDIKSDSFRWHSERFISGTWKTFEDVHARRMATVSHSSAAFQQLLSLAGDWRGEHDGKETSLKYTVTADGSALMEEFRPGGPPMITMFSVDGDHLVATHYCSAGNQPQMLTPTIADPRSRTLAFSLARITGMNTPDDWHNTGLELHLVDADHLAQHWSWQVNGKSGTTDFQFVRKKD